MTRAAEARTVEVERLVVFGDDAASATLGPGAADTQIDPRAAEAGVKLTAVASALGAAGEQKIDHPAVSPTAEGSVKPQPSELLHTERRRNDNS